MLGRMGQLAVIAQALRHARALAERERWPLERREARQRERLTLLVRHAVRHSAYYRQALAGYDPAVGAASLPEAVVQPSAATRPPAAPSTGRPFHPVVTLNGWSLPWRMKDRVKEFHLVAEPVVREIAPGMKADLVLLDPATVIDRSTFEEPRKLSEGIVWVAVNGAPVWENGKVTGARPGRALAGKGAKGF